MKTMKALCTAGVAVAVLGSGAMLANHALAADHQEAPGTTAQLSADIGDYYAWHEGSQMNLILTFGTFATPDMGGSYDRNLLYSFHFDTSAPADGISDFDIHARFAQDTEGNWGLQVSGIGSTPLSGPVDTTLSNGQFSAWGGVADDPFFFDQTGFNETISTGVLAFNPERDDVAGLNVTAIAIQVPIDSIMPGGGTFQTWTTTNSL